MAVVLRFGSSAPPPPKPEPKLMKPKVVEVRLTSQMPEAPEPKPTTDLEVRQVIQDACNVCMRWERLQEHSSKYRTPTQKSDLTKFFKKAMYDVWVDSEKRPLMTPEDGISVFLATAMLLYGDVVPDKVKAMEVAVKKGRVK